MDEESDTCAQVRRTTMATQITAEAADKTERPWHEFVPSGYHRYGKVFSEIKAQQFPESRQWDHAIDLKPDALLRPRAYLMCHAFICTYILFYTSHVCLCVPPDPLTAHTGHPRYLDT